MTPQTISRFKWASRILMLVSGALAIVAASDSVPSAVAQYTSLAVAVLAFAARWAEQQIPARKEGAAPPAAMLLVLAMLPAAGCPSLAPGYSALGLARAAGDQAGILIATTCRSKRDSAQLVYTRCSGACRASTDESGCMASCAKVRHEAMDGCHEALKVWVLYTKPGLNAGLASAFAALDAARASRDHKPWLEIVRPAICGVMSAVLALKDVLGSKAQKLVAPLQGLKGIVCPHVH